MVCKQFKVRRGRVSKRKLEKVRRKGTKKHKQIQCDKFVNYLRSTCEL